MMSKPLLERRVKPLRILIAGSLTLALLIGWTITSEACTPSPSFTCDGETVEGCPNGCYLVSPTQKASLQEAISTAKLVPGLRIQVHQLTIQRDLSISGASATANTLLVTAMELEAAKVRLDDAYGTSDIIVTGGLGLAAGFVASIIVWILI